MPSMRIVKASVSTVADACSSPIPVERRRKLIAPPVAIIVLDGMQSSRWAAPPITSRSTTVTVAAETGGERCGGVASRTAADDEKSCRHGVRGYAARNSQTFPSSSCQALTLDVGDACHDVVPRRRPISKPEEAPCTSGMTTRVPPAVARWSSGRRWSRLAALGWFVVRPALTDDERRRPSSPLPFDAAESTSPGSVALVPRRVSRRPPRTPRRREWLGARRSATSTAALQPHDQRRRGHQRTGRRQRPRVPT